MNIQKLHSYSPDLTSTIVGNILAIFVQNHLKCRVSKIRCKLSITFLLGLIFVVLGFLTLGLSLYFFVSICLRICFAKEKERIKDN